MRRKNLKQQARRNIITEETLIIGVDIGKEQNAVVLMDRDGILQKEIPCLYNSHKGYRWFIDVVGRVMRRKRFKRAVMGLEPTGHYFRKLAFFAKEYSIEVRLVKTTALKHQKVLDESSPAKGDMRDAYTIANLIREGKFCDTILTEDVYQKLRRLCKYREKQRNSLSATLNTLTAWLDDYFPELRSFFSTAKAVSLRALLRKMPTPKEVRDASLKEIKEIIARASRRRKTAEEKARLIKEAAQISIGLKGASEGDILRLKFILDTLDHYERQLKEIEKPIEKLLYETDEARYILSIKGIGVISAAIFLGELGDPKGFERAKEIVSYSGLDPYETESGQFFGRRKISKQGRYLLRAIIYRMVISTIRHNKVLKSYYQRLLEDKTKRLKKKEAICAVAIKLTRILFALMRDKREFVDELNQKESQAA